MFKTYCVSTPIPFTSCVVEEFHFNSFIDQISLDYEIVKEYDHWISVIDRHIFETKFYAVNNNDNSSSKIYLGSICESYTHDELKFEEKSL